MRFLSMIFLIVLVSHIPQILLLTQANQTQAQQIDNSAYYRLTNSYAGPGKSLSVSGPNRAVVMADTAESNDQLWKLTPTSGGKYRIVNVTAGDGKSLDNKMSDGQYFVSMGNTGSYTGQFWTLSPLGAGKYRLTNDFAGPTKSLDNRMSDGQYSVVMGDTGNYSGQYWTLTRSTTTVSINVPYITQPSTPVSVNVPNIPGPERTPIVITQPGNSIDVTPTTSATPSPSAGGEPVYVTLWDPSKIPSGGGSMLCSVDLRGSHESCGFTKADWIGRHQVNTTCAEGFYDPIWGGTCWNFPADDKKGTWVRGTTPITADDAVWRAPKESFARADEMRLGLAGACKTGEGEFWDAVTREGTIGGGCWKCPADHPRRTNFRVDAKNACASPLNETARAVFLSYNGCPKPVPAKMKLKGKRMPGKPFLDLGSGCYSCPNADEEGNILITERNANPIAGDAYDNNRGCTILFKWKPPAFPEPGMNGILGVKQVLFDYFLFENPDILTAYLTEMGKELGFQPGTPQSTQYVTQQWEQIAAAPYKSPALSSFVFEILEDAANAEVRSEGEERLVKSVEQYVMLRRTFIAEQALAMYDAWSRYDEKTREWRKQSRLETTGFDFGTVPLDFHSAVGAAFGLGATGAAVAGSVVGANEHAAGVAKAAIEAVKKVRTTGKTVRWADTVKYAEAAKSFKEAISITPVTRARNVDVVLKSIRGFRMLTAAQLAIAGPAILIELVGVILESIAIDQFIAIQEARPKLLAAIEEAKQPVNLKDLFATENGKDEITYFWSKAMDNPSAPEDQQVIAKARAALELARKKGFTVTE